MKGKTVKSINIYLGKCDLIVTKNTMSNSKPCKHCTEFLKKHGIRRIYYSYENDFIMEKTQNLKSDHLSAKYKKPWSQFNQYIK